MKTYFLDGKEAQGNDYLPHLESLADEDDLLIGIPGERGLMVSVYSEGYLVVEERSDGSSYSTTVPAKERVGALIDGFLNETEDWRNGLEWELTTFPSKRAAHRMAAVLLVGGILVALVWWLTSYLSQ